MGTDKRARQKANRQRRLEQQQAEAAKETREVATRRWGRIAAVIGAIVVLIVLFGVLRGGDDDAVSVAPTFADTETEEPTPIPEIVLAESVPDDFVAFAGERALAAVVPQARTNAYSDPPPQTIDPAKMYIAVIDTDAGAVSLELFADQAPVTVNNFVNLARDGFYDGTVFHRVLEGFMAQGGDPTGTGIGSPGYQFDDEIGANNIFDRPGLLAMANSGPNTNGSQFFITLEALDRSDLDKAHTIFGEVVRNPEVLESIVRVDPQEPSDGQEPLTIVNSIQIIEG